MCIKIPFANKTININLPQSSVLGVYPLNPVESTDERAVIKDAIENPINSPSYEEFIQDGTVVIVNDATRSTPTSKVLDFLYPKLQGRKIKFVIACGSHPPPIEEGLRFIFGKHLKTTKDKIQTHNAEKNQFISPGKDRYGNKLEVSKTVHNAPRIITISSVEPHYFAGFMGGRKSFLPGVASYSTIEQNHSLSLDPRATTLNLKDNPVHLGMTDCVRKIGEERIFAIQLVADRNGKIYQVQTGNIEKAFEESISACMEVSCVRLAEPVDIAVTVAQYPTDINFYRVQKTIENAKLAVKKGGAILFVSGCREGVGDRGFIDIFKRAGSKEKAMELVRRDFRLGYQKTYKLAELQLEKEIWGYAGVDPSVLSSCFIKPILDLNKTLNEEGSEGKKIAFFPQGNLTVPYVDD